MRNLLEEMNIAKWTDKLEKLGLDNKKIFLIIFIGLLIIYLDWAIFLKLQLRGIGGVNTRITKLKQDMDTLAKDLVNMQEIKNKQAQVGKGALLKAKKIISEQELALLLQNIANLANKNSVKLMQIKPGKPLRDIKAASALEPLLITLDLVCDYHHFGAFLNDIENAREFMAVEEMRISPDNVNYLQQKVNLVLRTYVKK